MCLKMLMTIGTQQQDFRKLQAPSPPPYPSILIPLPFLHPFFIQDSHTYSLSPPVHRTWGRH